MASRNPTVSQEPQPGGEYGYADALEHGKQRGRGAQLNPGSRYETTRLHVLGKHLDHVASRRHDAGGRPCAGGPCEGTGEGDSAAPLSDTIDTHDDAGRRIVTQVYADRTRTLINHVDSPDQKFSWTINPYRGCEHGCIYCYARPYHEQLGFSCGLDFETKIMAKFDAPDLLRKELNSRRWKGEGIFMAGVTDCYQPVERRLRITRRCLEIMAACRQPVSIVTKSSLVLRDVDLLVELARYDAVSVALSVTSLDNQMSSRLEPRACSPGRRLEAVRELAKAGVPVMVMVAPIVPGLTDEQVPAIIQAAADAGAYTVGYTIMRLPHQVKALFLDWVKREYPHKAARMESLLRSMRDGRLNDPSFGSRMKGTGQMAQQIGSMFKVFKKRAGLPRAMAGVTGRHFRRPEEIHQGRLF